MDCFCLAVWCDYCQGFVLGFKGELGAEDLSVYVDYCCGDDLIFRDCGTGIGDVGVGYILRLVTI